MATLFWSSLFFIFYAYLGYPLLLMLLSVIKSRPVKKGDVTPSVSLIITAHNEEARIREKLENTLALDYPRERLEIIAASDGSTDETDTIVQSHESRGVRLVRAAQRNGKEAAQKLAVQAASGEVLIFSDVATILESNAIRNIVKNFADPTVGCVSSVDKIIDAAGKVSGEGAYVRYEMLLRNLETRANTLVGLSGSFFAARREVCQNWQPELQSDFNTLLNAVNLGLRGVSDQESIGYYKTIADETKEYERKVRTVLRGIAVFMKSLPMLNPFRYGLFSWQLLSHKLCRWLVPFAMLAAFFSNATLIYSSPFYLCLFVLQCAGYGIAIQSIWIKRSSQNPLLKFSTYLVIVNLSILDAWFRYCRGERVVLWNPSQREVS
jgi:cellulose synthase/poly-beta-1,6-N-acetylglucosamine synthase-like glycosyltransferase